MIANVVNEHGHVVVIDGVPSGYVHIDQPRLGPTCRRLGIEYAKAVVEWDIRYRRTYPIVSGIVIASSDWMRLARAVVAKRRKHRKAVRSLPVLSALFTLNRRAKRCRDLAQVYYWRSMHGLAGKCRAEKERIYWLKGQVLHYMVEANVVSGGSYHMLEAGNWAEVLRGEGYTFHRPCPAQIGVVPDRVPSIEAKPKGAREPSLAVAFEVVERFLEDKEIASVYQWPPKAKASRRRYWRDEDCEDDDWDNSDWDDD